MTANEQTDSEHINRPSPQDGKGTDAGLGSEGGPTNFGLYIAEHSEEDIDVEVETIQSGEIVALEFTGRFGSFAVEYGPADARGLANEITNAAGGEHD